jgi:TolB protein
MNKHSGLNPKVFVPIFVLLVIGNLALVSLFVLPGLTGSSQSLASETTQPFAASPSLTATANQPGSLTKPSATFAPTATLPPEEALAALRQQGVMFFSMSDGLNRHLFAYHPQYFSLTRLTNSPWDDIQPVLSPDGTKIAYSSRQNGYWDIFIFDLATGKTERLTDTPEYEAAGSWSPDGQWLTAEKLVGDCLQVVLISVSDRTTPPLQLTNFSSSSYDPQWSLNGGREIAFVSMAGGKEDVWLARLDRIDDRFVNLTKAFAGNHRQPRWSPDGSLLAWSAEQPDESMDVETWNPQNASQAPHIVGPGTNPIWAPDGSIILAEVPGANSTSLTAYKTGDGQMAFPMTRLPGMLYGLDWRSGPSVELLVRLPLPDAARQPAAILWQKKLQASPAPPLGRFGIVKIQDVVVPYPYLQDSADEAFNALREMIGRESGWDFLANLENAYVPLTVAALPGMEENWLNTGRAIAVNPVPMSAGWMVTLREDIAGKTYWRVYLRARYQDGSQGIPLTEPAWDLNARNSGSPEAYDQGGEYNAVPEGYWVDFTELASRYGWERLPALVDWRTYYQAARYNQFVEREGLDWQTAMNQLYPPEAIATPTPLITQTATETPTRTPWYYKWITPTLTPSITLTPTRRPTLTPIKP